MNFLAHWVHDLSPFLIEFPESVVETIHLPGIRYYGLAYLIGFGIAYYLLQLYYKKGYSTLNPDLQSSLITYIIVGVLLGGRMGYMFLYDIETFLSNPFLLFKVWEGGMASHGGFAGVILALIIFAYKNNINRFRLGDIIATLTPAGLMFGRIANFINGELWGKPSEVKWAMIFPKSEPVYNAVTGFAQVVPRHPSQLYAAFLEGFILVCYTQWRFWKTDPNKVKPGRIGAEFLMGYAIVRIIGEMFREPHPPNIMGLSRGQFFSVFIFIGGIAVWVISQRQTEKNNLS